MTDLRGGDATTKREYESIVITIDPVSQGAARPQDGEHVQKYVMSTQTALASLFSLFTYYREQHMALSPKTAELIQQAGIEGGNVVWVYMTPNNTEIVIDADTFMDLVGHPEFGQDSLLVATEKLIELAARFQAQLFQSRGAAVPLYFLVMGQEGLPAPAPGPIAEELIQRGAVGDPE